METIILSNFQILVEITTALSEQGEYLLTDDLEGIGTQQGEVIEVEE